MLIARIFTLSSVGTLSIDQIMNSGIQALKMWQEYSWPPYSHGERKDLIRAFDTLQLKDVLSTIIKRSVFFPVNAENFRFKHREWQDFLAGRYFAFCIKNLNVLETTTGASTQRAFKYGGELLFSQGWQGVDISLIKTVIKFMKLPSGPFVIGNFGGLVGNSLIPIQPGGMELLANNHWSIPRAGKLTFFATLGTRVLTKAVSRENRDVSWNAIQENLVKMLSESLGATLKLSHSEVHGQDMVTASISWCFLKVIAEQFDLDCAPKVKWPFPNLDERQEIEALDGTLGKHGPMGFESPIPRGFLSVQIAYLAIQDLIIAQPKIRPISVAHYLFLLSLAYKRGAAAQIVAQQLPSILKKDSANLKILENYELPEIRELVVQCKKWVV
jgi:hypothetical protein